MPTRLTRAVKFLLIANFAAFIIQQTADQFFGAHLMGLFALTPAAVTSLYLWQILTYSFIHADVSHLVFNLIMIFFIGTELEALWGALRLLRYYFFCATSAALVQLALQILFIKSGAIHPMIGSSAGIYGLLVAYGLFFGERILLFMMIFPLKAKHFVWVLALIELLTTVYSSGGFWTGISQLSGMIAGFGYLWARANFNDARKRPSLGQRQKKRRPDHLKLVVNNGSDFESGDDDRPDNPKTWH